MIKSGSAGLAQPWRSVHVATRLLPVLPVAIVLAGCASLPGRQEFADSVAAYPGGTVQPAEDGRARFREILCSLVPATGHAGDDKERDPASHCDRLLWKLADEASGSGLMPAQPAIAPGLRIFIVSGAFGDCLEPDTIPYGDEIARLSAQGLKIEAVMVSGRSSAEHNADQLAERITAADVGDGERIVLVGYSKGVTDILQFLVGYPDLSRHVAAVVSVSGPVYGSPLSSDAEWWYRTFLRKALSGMCDPGDGGVISSLKPEVRRQWMEDHALPGHVRYFSLAAFTTKRHLARVLRTTWRILAAEDRRNDGQVLVENAVIPHSTLLGYANADHWDVAIAVERRMPYLASRESPRVFPRDQLLDAMLMYVSEALGREDVELYGPSGGEPQ